jgi:hypothetical protein
MVRYMSQNLTMVLAIVSVRTFRLPDSPPQRVRQGVQKGKVTSLDRSSSGRKACLWAACKYYRSQDIQVLDDSAATGVRIRSSIRLLSRSPQDVVRAWQG